MVSGPVQIRVWDWTVRLFHWSLVVLIAAMWWTAEEGHMGWHKWLGLGLVALLTYRVVWGVIGPKTARLLSLVPTPNRLIVYIRSIRSEPYVPSVGHNPLGSLSVIALLTVVFVQVVSGLFAVDVDGLFSGWLGRFVSFDLGRTFAEFHETTFNVLVALIGLHVLAILAYLVFLKTNLVSAMITGKQARDTEPKNYEPVDASPFRVIVSALVALSVVWLIISFGG